MTVLLLFSDHCRWIAGRGSRGLSLPITLFSIPLGLAGLGAAWAAAADVLGPVTSPTVAAALLWGAFLVVYVVGTVRHKSPGSSRCCWYPH